mmetsp:Transcript_40669/g.100497  ORF Transcript_40669/g.100497 Transcript_40669/m.100497 type:complete len:201 (+) Transcript_40669:162-764(+)
MAALPLLLAALGAASPMHAMRTCAQPTAASQTRMMIFGPSESQKRAQEEQMKVQQAMLARRRNPKATEKYFKDLEERREKTSVQWFDKFAWQRKADSADYNKMDEFKKRLSAGKIKEIGYADQQPAKAKFGFTLPMASFGVGGEAGVGGKYDNGERFDLRLPYADEGWIEETPKGKPKQGGVKSAESPAPGPFDWLFGKK